MCISYFIEYSQGLVLDTRVNRSIQFNGARVLNWTLEVDLIKPQALIQGNMVYEHSDLVEYSAVSVSM